MAENPDDRERVVKIRELRRLRVRSQMSAPMSDERLLHVKRLCVLGHDPISRPDPIEAWNALGETLNEVDRLRAERTLTQRKLRSAAATLRASHTDLGSSHKQILTLIDGTAEQAELQLIRAERKAKR